jgi:hypothetical protein
VILGRSILRSCAIGSSIFDNVATRVGNGKQVRSKLPMIEVFRTVPTGNLTYGSTVVLRTIGEGIHQRAQEQYK